MISVKECKWLWVVSQGVRRHIAFGVVLGLLRIATTLIFVYLCKHIVDIATKSSSGNITHIATLLAGVMLTDVVLSSLYVRVAAQSGIMLKNKIRHRLFSHMIYTRNDELHSGDILSRMEEDVRVVSEFSSSLLPSLFVSGIQLCAAFVFLYLMDSMLAGVLILIMPLLILTGRFFIRRIKTATLDIRKSESLIHAYIQESVQHRVVIQVFERCRQMISTLISHQIRLYGEVMGRSKFTLLSRTTVSLGFAVGYFTTFLWGVSQLHQGAITFGMMTAFLQLTARIQRPTVELSRNIPGIIHASASVQRLMEMESFPTQKQEQVIMLSGSAGLRLENITYRYPDGDNSVISNFSYDFTPGSLTAIVGHTGVGKTTLIRLMLGVCHTQKGALKIYNNDFIINVSGRTLCNMTYVPQGNSLLSGTIRENLLIGNPDATIDQINKALYTAIAEFVFNLPDGLDTLCGEAGVRLSEGEAQRISIARALLREGSVLLFDEITSALDGETESHLMKRLTEYCKGKTMIFITHNSLVANYCNNTIQI